MKTSSLLALIKQAEEVKAFDPNLPASRAGFERHFPTNIYPDAEARTWPGYADSYSFYSALPSPVFHSAYDFLSSALSNAGKRNDGTDMPKDLEILGDDSGKWDRGGEYSVDSNPNATEYEWLRVFGGPEGIKPGGTNVLNLVHNGTGIPIDWDSVGRMTGSSNYPASFFATPEQVGAVSNSVVQDLGRVRAMPKPVTKEK